MPNLLSFPTSLVCLEPRPLPSTGITRLQRYYGPLRHHKAPGTSLTGFRLAIPDHAMGLPVLHAFPLCTCCRHYPGTASGCFLCSLHQTSQPSPHWQTGRPVHRPFRGLLSVHSRYGLHTRQVTICDPLYQRLQPLRLLHDCSDCFRLEQKLPGGTLTHWENAALPRRTPKADMQFR